MPNMAEYGRVYTKKAIKMATRIRLLVIVREDVIKAIDIGFESNISYMHTRACDLNVYMHWEKSTCTENQEHTVFRPLTGNAHQTSVVPNS